MLFLDPNVKGTHVKLGELGWVKVADLKSSKMVNGELVISKKKGNDIVYKGKHVERVKKVLDKEIKP